MVKKGESKAEQFWQDCGINCLIYEDPEEIVPFLEALCDDAADKMKDVGTCDEGSVIPSHTADLDGGELSFPPSDSIPEHYPEIRKRALGECIVLAFASMGDNENARFSWSSFDISLEGSLRFIKPSRLLKKIQNNMAETYKKQNFASSPRFSLVGLKINPKSHFRDGGICVTYNLTDWSLVHGIQATMISDRPETVEVRDLFWKSVNSLVTINTAENFPHHMAVHVLVITKDKRIVVNKRIGVENQRGRISVSFEEQMQFPFIYSASDEQPIRFFDGDESVVDSVIRGAKEELNIKLLPDQVNVCALCMEATSIAANFITVVKCDYTINEIYELWHKAEDKSENRMVEPAKAPLWNLDSMVRFITKDRAFPDDPVFCDPWHASSRMRILCGLILEYGYEAVSKRIDFKETW